MLNYTHTHTQVFIHNGQLHIIPKPSSPADIPRLPVAMPTVEAAIKIVSDTRTPTTADEAVQGSIQSRIKWLVAMDLWFAIRHENRDNWGVLICSCSVYVVDKMKLDCMIYNPLWVWEGVVYSIATNNHMFTNQSLRWRE